MFKNETRTAIDRMFHTAAIAYIASNLSAAIGPLVDGIIVGSNYHVNDVAAIGLTSFLLVGYRTITASILSSGSHVIAPGESARVTGMEQVVFLLFQLYFRFQQRLLYHCSASQPRSKSQCLSGRVEALLI